jgi:hypothetical protein
MAGFDEGSKLSRTCSEKNKTASEESGRNPGSRIQT